MQHMQLVMIAVQADDGPSYLVQSQASLGLPPLLGSVPPGVGRSGQRAAPSGTGSGQRLTLRMGSDPGAGGARRANPHSPPQKRRSPLGGNGGPNGGSSDEDAAAASSHPQRVVFPVDVTLERCTRPCSRVSLAGCDCKWRTHVQQLLSLVHGEHCCWTHQGHGQVGDRRFHEIMHGSNNSLACAAALTGRRNVALFLFTLQVVLCAGSRM